MNNEWGSSFCQLGDHSFCDGLVHWQSPYHSWRDSRTYLDALTSHCPCKCHGVRSKLTGGP